MENRSNDLRIHRPMCFVQLVYNALIPGLRDVDGVFLNYREKKTQISLMVEVDENGTGIPFIPPKVQAALNKELESFVVKPESYKRLVIREMPYRNGKGRLVGGPNGEAMNLAVRRDRKDRSIQDAMLIIGENRTATILDVDDNTRKFRLTRISLTDGAYKETRIINWKYIDVTRAQTQVAEFLLKVFSFVSRNNPDSNPHFVEMVLAGYRQICGAYQWEESPLYCSPPDSQKKYPQAIEFEIPPQRKRSEVPVPKKTKLVIRKTAVLKSAKKSEEQLAVAVA